MPNLDQSSTVSLDRIKRAAKHLKRALSSVGHPVAHTKCLESIASGFGLRSYAALKSGPLGLPPAGAWDGGRAADRLLNISDVPLSRVELIDVIAQSVSTKKERIGS